MGNFLRVDNQMAEVLATINLSGFESRVFWAIYRQTTGFNRESLRLEKILKLKDWTRISELSRISEALRSLVSRKIVIRDRKQFSINRNYNEWDLRKSVKNNLRKSVNNVTENRKNQLRKTVSFHDEPKDSIKNSIKDTHEGKCVLSFEKFWKEYPRHVLRDKALNEWQKINPDESLANIIISAIQKQRLSDQWLVRKAIPNPATWLKNERWRDILLITFYNDEQMRREFKTHGLNDSDFVWDPERANDPENKKCYRRRSGLDPVQL